MNIYCGNLYLIVIYAVLFLAGCFTQEETWTYQGYYIQNEMTGTLQLVGFSEGDTLFTDSVASGQRIKVGEQGPSILSNLIFFSSDSVYLTIGSILLWVNTYRDTNSNVNVLDYSHYLREGTDGDEVIRVLTISEQ